MIYLLNAKVILIGSETSYSDGARKNVMDGTPQEDTMGGYENF